MAVALCLLGAVVVIVAAGRTWVELPAVRDALLPGRRRDVTGSDLAPGVRALGVVGLAGVVALAATRSRGRTLVGLLLAVVGGGVGLESVRAATDLEGRLARMDQVQDAAGTLAVEGTAWPWVAVVGGVLLMLAGLLVAVRGRHWAGLSARYEPPIVNGGSVAPVDPSAVARSAPDRSDRALWDELDRGGDPTQR